MITVPLSPKRPRTEHNAPVESSEGQNGGARQSLSTNFGNLILEILLLLLNKILRMKMKNTMYFDLYYC